MQVISKSQIVPFSLRPRNMKPPGLSRVQDSLRDWVSQIVRAPGGINVNSKETLPRAPADSQILPSECAPWAFSGLCRLGCDSQDGFIFFGWFEDPEFNFSLIGAGNVEEHVPFNLLNEHLCVIILTRADYDQSCGYFATSFFEPQPFPKWKDWITCAIGPQDQQRTEGTTVPKTSKKTCTPGTPN